jgi:hypothetical protein
MVGTLLTRTKNSRKKDGQQTQETAVSFVAARLWLNALGRVPAELNAVFPPWAAVLQYP